MALPKFNFFTSAVGIESLTFWHLQVGKSEMKNVGGPIFDPSLDDFDMPDLQV